MSLKYHQHSKAVLFLMPHLNFYEQKNHQTSTKPEKYYKEVTFILCIEQICEYSIDIKHVKLSQ